MLPPNWVEYIAEDGQPYYHNTITDTTTWNRPSPVTPKKSVGSEMASLSGLDGGLSTRSGGSSLMGDHPFASEVDMQSADLSGVPSGKLDERDMSDNDNISEGAASRMRLTGQVGTESSRDVGLLDSVGQRVCSCCDLSSLKSYFKVNTSDVSKRLYLSVLPTKAVTTDSENDLKVNPDLYGPFWIATTLVLVLFVCANSHLLAKGTVKRADYSFLYRSACLVYGAVGCVPVGTLGVAMVSQIGVRDVHFIQVLCIFGYALTVLIPVTLLCLIPVNALRWLACLVGYGVSAVFVFRNLKEDLDVPVGVRNMMALVLVGIEVGMYVLVRLCVFG